MNTTSAILTDLSTGTVLYEKNADEPIPPASLTKLMSLHLAYKAVEAGLIGLDDPVAVSPAASYKNSPPRSSLMFLEEGQKVTLLEIMKGLAIPSGNDAGIALAEVISGGLEPFVEEMNREAQALGLSQTWFVDSFGYSEENTTTARDYAKFCAYYIERHPRALEELHALMEFTYPSEENMNPPGVSGRGPITQYNHNRLVGRLDGVDGLKTGYIDESGYNLAVTAERGGRRLLAVMLGGPEVYGKDGDLVRALDAAALLTYGFTAYASFVPQPPEIPPLRVWKAREKFVELEYPPLPVQTLERTRAAGLRWELKLNGGLTAPFEKGAPAGSLICLDSQGTVLFASPLATAEGAPKGPWWRRLWDNLRLFFTGK